MTFLSISIYITYISFEITRLILIYINISDPKQNILVMKLEQYIIYTISFKDSKYDWKLFWLASHNACWIFSHFFLKKVLQSLKVFFRIFLKFYFLYFYFCIFTSMVFFHILYVSHSLTTFLSSISCESVCEKFPISEQKTQLYNIKVLWRLTLLGSIHYTTQGMRISILSTSFD